MGIKLTTLEDNIGEFDCGCSANANRNQPLSDSMFAPIPGLDTPLAPRRCTCGRNPCTCGARGGATATANPVININIDSNKNNTASTQQARPQQTAPTSFDAPPQKTYIDEYLKSQAELQRLKNQPARVIEKEKRVEVPIKQYVNMPIDRVRTQQQQTAQSIPVDRVRTEVKQNPITMIVDRVKNLFTQKAQVIPVDRVERSAKATRPQQIFKTSM